MTTLYGLKFMNNNPPTKKKIIVRKLNTRPNENSTSSQTHIPLVANDSKWSGIEINRNRRSSEIENIENEIQIIDVEQAQASSQDELPLFQLFPDLQNELSSQSKINAQMSTTNITKMLVGRKADFSLLKPSKKLAMDQKLSSLAEETETDNTKENSKAQNLTINDNPQDKTENL